MSARLGHQFVEAMQVAVQVVLLGGRQGAHGGRNAFLQQRRCLAAEPAAPHREQDEYATLIVLLPATTDETAGLEPVDDAGHCGGTEPHCRRQLTRLHGTMQIEEAKTGQLRSAQAKMAHQLTAVQVQGSDDATDRTKNVLLDRRRRVHAYRYHRAKLFRTRMFCILTASSAESKP